MAGTKTKLLLSHEDTCAVAEPEHEPSAQGQRGTPNTCGRRVAPYGPRSCPAHERTRGSLLAGRPRPYPTPTPRWRVCLFTRSAVCPCGHVRPGIRRLAQSLESEHRPDERATFNDA